MQAKSKDGTVLRRECAHPKLQMWEERMGWSMDEGWSLETSAAVS